jgi:hypothetical protein
MAAVGPSRRRLGVHAKHGSFGGMSQENGLADLMDSGSGNAGEFQMPSKREKPEEHIEYHKDGSIWAKGQMTNGVPVGYWEWFRKDGSRMRSGTFADGKQVGEWTTYGRAGEVYKVTRFKT